MGGLTVSLCRPTVGIVICKIIDNRSIIDLSRAPRPNEGEREEEIEARERTKSKKNRGKESWKKNMWRGKLVVVSPNPFPFDKKTLFLSDTVEFSQQLFI
jgi:hypothetical protein